MSKISLIAFFLIYCSILNAQNYQNLEFIKLSEQKDYIAVETKVLDCSNFIINNPTYVDKEGRLNAISFLKRWVEGTHHHSFTENAYFLKFSKEKFEISSVYYAAYAKAVITSKPDNNSIEDINAIAIQTLLDYCTNPKNRIKLTNGIKKLLKERNK